MSVVLIHRVLPAPAAATFTTTLCCRLPKNIIKCSHDDHLDRPRPPEAHSPSSVADLKSALGIDKKSSSSSPLTNLGFKDLELSDNGEGEEYEKDSFLWRLEQLGEWFVRNTEGGLSPEWGVGFLLIVIPLWLLYLFAAAGWVQLPFTLPFLES